MKRYVKEYASDILTRYKANKYGFIALKNSVDDICRQNEKGRITDMETISILNEMDRNTFNETAKLNSMLYDIQTCSEITGEPEVGYDEEREVFTLNDYHEEHGHSHYRHDLASKKEVDADMVRYVCGKAHCYITF